MQVISQFAVRLLPYVNEWIRTEHVRIVVENRIE